MKIYCVNYYNARIADEINRLHKVLTYRKKNYGTATGNAVIEKMIVELYEKM